MKYFKNCSTIEDLKREYRRLASIHHPDLGGDLETMKAINNEYDLMFNRLKDVHNAANAGQPERQTTEAPEEFRAIVNALLKCEGLIIELCGSWLWISGETMKNKEALKSSGCKWASKKRMWYWRHEEDGAHHSRGKLSIDQIRSKYGSEIVAGSQKREVLTA